MKKKQARALWDLSFDDNRAFTELYFKLRYTDQNTVLISNSEGEAVSGMQLLPYPFAFLNYEVKSAYISGACTHPQYRSQGLMSKLMGKSFNQLREQKIPICTLIPAEKWLFDYYKKSDFITLFYKTTTSLTLADSKEIESAVQIKHTDQFDNSVHEYLNRKKREKSAALLHTKDDLEVILADLRLAKGEVFIAYNEDGIEGIALAFLNPSDEKIYVNELLFDSADSKQALLQAMATHFSSKQITITSYPEFNKEEPLGMLRIIDAPLILQLFAKHNLSWSATLEIEDPLIPYNNGLFKIANGEVKRLTKEESKVTLKMDIAQLAKALFTPLKPYMSLMLN